MRKYLSAAAVARLKKPGRYAVADNCYLQISKWNTRAWVYRYTHNGQAHHMGLGPYRLVTLAEARSKAREAARLILNGDLKVTIIADRVAARLLQPRNG